MSEIRTDTINNASGDNDSGIDLSTNDQVGIKTADTTAVTVDSSQQVGIGTSSPATKIHLSATDGNSIMRMTRSNSASTDDNFGSIEFQNSAGTVLAGIKGTSMSGNTEGGIIFGAGGGNAERMRLDNSGNVGINENSPDTKLHASRNVAGTPLATFENTASHEASIRFKSAHSSSSDFRVGASISASNNFEIYSVGAATARMKITNNGFMQVPATHGNTTGSGANMHVTAGGEFARSTSSQRYKNTINDATHGLTELLTLRPVTYKGNNDGDTVFGGLIAEEVHDAGLTEFVEYNDDGQPDALAYGNMVSLCIKAIQELSVKVTTLETANTALEARIEALENA